METACAQAAQYATVPVPAAVSHALISLFTAFPALFIALLAWRYSRKDSEEQIEHLREENQQLTESLRLAMYAKGGAA